jgi:hypothetical protein
MKSKPKNEERLQVISGCMHCMELGLGLTPANLALAKTKDLEAFS